MITGFQQHLPRWYFVLNFVLAFGGWLFEIIQGQSLLGEIIQAPHKVNPFSFPELTHEILEKIKKATGQPIDTNRFMPLHSTKGVLIYQPSLKRSKYLKQSHNRNGSGKVSIDKGGKNSGKTEKAHYSEASTKSKKGTELEEQEFGDIFGGEHQFLEERFLKINHHEEGDEEGKEKHKMGRNRGKYFIKKGYRDIFHRDETRKSDSFWDKLHEEGEWFHYGLRNKKKEKKEKLGEQEKNVEDKKERSEWEKEMSNANEKEEKEIRRKINKSVHNSITI